MIKVSVMYPNGKGIEFDDSYYKNRHLPMVAKALGSELKGLELDLGISGGSAGSKATYAAITHLKFDSLESFQRSFGPYAAEFAADTPNYTNSTAEIQISEPITFDHGR